MGGTITCAIIEEYQSTNKQHHQFKQGPQWWSVGRRLYENKPLFTKWINLIDKQMIKVVNNIYPSFIISHSAGDQVTVFAAGYLTLEEAVRIVYQRLRLQNRNTRQGDGIEDLACIAVVNSPHSVTISDDEKTIDEIQQILLISYPIFDIEKDMLLSLKDIRGYPIKDQKQIFNPICTQAKLYSSVTGDKMNDNIPVDE
ncbi:unnamed protein product [Adineta steineri]|uniref:Malonyl-CoA:ACP transacylase (MAT) domain-containing protein n=1 Tax=Adineta steineri TaxID=433720 RepID=A0A815BMY6_9BILA|nr:unnamed protein product [Adineta steineri]CAF3950963.1 unnamed protein product [Adineta steineri]